MAVSLTARLGLKRWSTSTDEWIGREGFNAQNQTLDDVIAIDAQGPISARPVSAVRGFYYYADDVEQLYRNTGTGWIPIGVDASKLVGKVPIASLPTQVPIGGGIIWFDPSIPDNYMKPRGQAISRTTYAALFALWGTRHGAGNGTTTFNLPNPSGRMPVAVDPNDPDFDTVGDTGGAKTVTLTTAQMPSHSHSGGVAAAGIGALMSRNPASDNSDPNGAVARGDGGTTGQRGINGSGHSHGLTINAEGGGQAHQNMPPFFAIEYIIRVL